MSRTVVRVQAVVSTQATTTDTVTGSCNMLQAQEPDTTEWPQQTNDSIWKECITVTEDT